MPGYATQSPTYQPSMRLVSMITNAANAVITTSFDHGYLVGLIVRVYVPSEFGMVQAHQMVGEVISVPSTSTCTIDVDTSNFDTFVFPDPEPWYINDYPMLVPIGEINSLLTQSVRNVL